MAAISGRLRSILRSADLRIFTILAVGVAIFGILDGSLWRGLLTPTIAYRPAILFALTLVFGWRGFAWSQVLFLAAFGLSYGWRGAVFITPLYFVSQGLGLLAAQRIAGTQPWLARERSTLGFLASAAIAPAIPAFFGQPFLALAGIEVGPALPAALDSWLRGIAGILALAPVLLVYCSRALRDWAGLRSSDELPEHTRLKATELVAEVAIWTIALWISVYLKQRYGLNVIYLVFLGPLSFTLLRGMGFATLTLSANALVATSLWMLLDWSRAISGLDLRLLVVSYSVTILVLATVVDERQQHRGQLARLLSAEAALRASEERFRLAIKATNDAVWDIDLKSGTVTWNDTYATIYGRPKTQKSWQFWIDQIHPDDRKRTADGFQAAVASAASSWSAEYRFARADGEWAHIYDRAYIARDASGAATRVIGAMLDLTSQKRAEAALRESEERFRRVFEEGPLGLALVARDYRFLQVNDALCQLVGYSEEELIQKTFTHITHPDDLQTDVDLAERLFKREIPFYRIQKRYIKKTGEIIWINLTASVLTNSDGEPIHGLAMVEDITEIKRSQEEALMRQKLESLGTLARGIAHDFNNLLGGVQAQAELALVELGVGLSCSDELKAIRDVATRGSEIVRQLMIYAGTESEAVEHSDLSQIVEEMLTLLQVSVTKHAVIKADLARDLTATAASAGQLRQIVMNLITNASDAIGEQDGVIRVITRPVALSSESAPSSSEASSNVHYLELEVSDTGRGMSPETLAKIFDPFFTTKSPGRGLGLAVVQGIVRSLDGAIHVTSEPDKGTTFQILLPCKEPPAPVGDSVAAAGEPVPKQSYAILVVDDEIHLRRPVGNLLRRAGFVVSEAADGTSAIELLRGQGTRLDAILLDMTIPGASSLDVIREAATIQPDIRIILTSAYSREMIEGSVRAQQIRSFIRKPFRFDDLLKTLRDALSS